ENTNKSGMRRLGGFTTASLGIQESLRDKARERKPYIRFPLTIQGRRNENFPDFYENLQSMPDLTGSTRMLCRAFGWQ
ncbi:MAG: hypothetical protein KAU14_08110, partial [Thermoplasmata archaeon]|nr:hypothetical protein [Thermoplasmata archaeon]